MLRFKLGVLLAFAVLIATEPVYHNHPLIPDGNASVQSLCAVCASGADRVTLSAPTVAAPDFVVYSLEAKDITIQARAVALTLPSRAPPTA
ncbi:MAG TPA: hypothetical protein VJ901_09855 [Thermoanaerobaculia bacterium]|nr:hypothetical protein [Thermoanaerobaculia bacterium]